MSYVTGHECLHCGATLPDRPHFEGCPECRSEEFVSNVVPTYDFDAIREAVSRDALAERTGGIWRFHELLPVDPEHAVTIGEGGTPLVACGEVGRDLGLANLYLKDESQNPTWSFKDRLASVAISKGVERGADVVTIASTGNHGASTAAYAGRAGLDCVVFTVPEVPETMKTLMGVYGAGVVATPAPEDRWTIMRACIEEYDWYPTGNYVFPPVGSNHYGIEGYKTIAYEICEELGWEAPDWVVQPTAYGDGLSGMWRGFRDLERLGFVDDTPRMVAVEPFGPLKNALESGTDRVESVETEGTVAFSIGVGTSTYQGLHAIRDSGGTAVLSDDEEIKDLQRTLGSTAGMYAEASAVASLAGIRSLREAGDIDREETVVAIDTSTGLKDTAMTAEMLPDVPTIEPELDELEDALREIYDISL